MSISWMSLIWFALTPALATPGESEGLSLELPEVFKPGELLLVQLHGVLPDAEVVLVRSDGTPAPGPCPDRLGGACLDLHPGVGGYVLEGWARADAAGIATWQVRAPVGSEGRRLGWQAVDVTTATSSPPWVGRVGVRSTCVDDGQEGDDLLTTARPLEPGQPQAAVACPDDPDMFGVFVPAGRRLEVGALFDHYGDGDLDLTLYDEEGRVLDQAHTLDDEEILRWHNRSGAEAWVAVHALMRTELGGAGGVRYMVRAEVR